jgi:ABC-type spermidine/putrescine transport system permease subunit II
MSVLAAVGIYLIFPTLVVVWLSFGTDPVIRYPPKLFTWTWYEKFIIDEQWNDALFRSLVIGASATMLATVIGSLAAFVLARSNFPGKQIIEGAAIAPLVVPPIVLAAGGYSLYLELGLVGTYTGLATMHAMLGLPYVFLIVSAAFSQSDPNIELAALSMGASRSRTVIDITLPAIVPSMLIGALFAFLVSFDEVVLTVFLSGALGGTIPVKIFASLRAEVSPVVAAASTLQVLAALFLLFQLGLLRRWQSKRAQSQYVAA